MSGIESLLSRPCTGCSETRPDMLDTVDDEQDDGKSSPQHPVDLPAENVTSLRNHNHVKFNFFNKSSLNVSDAARVGGRFRVFITYLVMNI